MNGKVVFHFDDTPVPPLGSVGGKGYSLIKMAQADLSIPPGFVLSVDFFRPWINELKKTESWRDFLAAGPDLVSQRAMALKLEGNALILTGTQHTTLEEALQRYGDYPLFAVRSSSPEEDLDGASFAGGYETILGTSRETMADAVRRAFCSCLDPRVFLYKLEQGFAIDDFRIAVVVQAQVASEVAGVGFSVNPLNNDYDEAVFSANWGLGESVVSGLTSPDQITVRKPTGALIDYHVGGKETAIWLGPNGGTTERPDPRHHEPCVDDQGIAALHEELLKVELLYGRPMDIEWAFSDGRLYLLQARPITTVLPLPKAMVTEPSDRRRLYVDITLVVQALTEPLSVMGTDVLKHLAQDILTTVFQAPEMLDVQQGLVGLESGRIYLNLSNGAHLFGTLERFGQVFDRMDSTTATIAREADENTYRASVPPAWLDKVNPWVLVKLPDVVVHLFEEIIAPKHLAHTYEKSVHEYVTHVSSSEMQHKALPDFVDELVTRTVRLLVHTVVPVFLLSMKAIQDLKDLFADAVGKDPSLGRMLKKIDRSLPHNVTTEMGLELYHLALLLEDCGFQSVDDLAHAFRSGNVPPEFTAGWNDFLERYGFRGAGELDIAAQRYVDDPTPLLSLMFYTVQSTETETPQAKFDRCQEERKEAYDTLLHHCREMGFVDAGKFKLLYRIVETFGGYRENHKYYVIQAISILRRKVLQESEKLVAVGRLDSIEQVFQLTLAQLGAGIDDETMDLRALARANERLIAPLRNRNLPAVVDSRGRVLRPKPTDPVPGEIRGQGVSSGIARGKVKVLRHVDEKPLMPGEILVTRATDPGWTPLFINAAAIVLEVGGILQHGALVAREYGKPCVVGITDAMQVLADGDLVEVDGSLGIVRRLEGPPGTE
jgi:phosphohistidine swiveling domain-containing protein